jgi:hypothetical protein
MQHSRGPTPKPFEALTIEEAREFEMLDALPPFDDSGNVAWIFEVSQRPAAKSAGWSFTRS